MRTRIALYGALREADPRGFIELDVPAGSRIGELREQLAAHLAEHAPAIPAGLLRRCAFASADQLLHNHHAVPEGVELAILPPVSGG